jgi:hypothetical protein
VNIAITTAVAGRYFLSHANTGRWVAEVIQYKKLDEEYKQETEVCLQIKKTPDKQGSQRCQ